LDPYQNRASNRPFSASSKPRSRIPTAFPDWKNLTTALHTPFRFFPPAMDYPALPPPFHKVIICLTQNLTPNPRLDKLSII
jgi:hypothetical protein